MQIAISGEWYRWDNVAPVLAAFCGNATCRVVTRCASVVFAYAAVLSAQSFTLPAGTVVPVVTTRSLRVADLQVGSSIELATASNIRNGAGINMIPAGTAIHGSVTSVRAKPLAIQVSLDRMRLRDGLNVALEGKPAFDEERQTRVCSRTRSYFPSHRCRRRSYPFTQRVRPLLAYPWSRLYGGFLQPSF